MSHAVKTQETFSRGVGGHNSQKSNKKTSSFRGHGHDIRDSFGRSYERKCRVSVRFCADRPKQPGKKESSPSVSIAAGDAKPTAATAITVLPPPTSSVLEAAINSLFEQSSIASKQDLSTFCSFVHCFVKRPLWCSITLASKQR
jgi:hypothetical protein